MSFGRQNLPERFSELVSLSFVLFGRLFTRAAVIAAVLFLPYLGLAALMGVPENTLGSSSQVIQRIAQEAGFSQPTGESLIEEGEDLQVQLVEPGVNASFLPSTATVFLNILLMLLGLFYTAGLVWLSESLIARGSIPLLREMFFKVFSSAGALILTGVLTYFLLMGWTLLLIVPGFIFFIYYIFSVYAVILRRHVGLKAIHYSKDLIKGQWRNTFLNLAGLAGIFLLLRFGANFLLSVLGTPLNFMGISEAASFLTGKILQAFLIIGVTLLFLRLEAKKKAF